MSTFPRAQTRLPQTAECCHRRPVAAVHQLSEVGIELVALRLGLLAHPTRLKLLRRLDEQDAGTDELARDLGLPPTAVASHLGVLYRAGVVCRVDRRGPAVYGLADWSGWWLVQQLATSLLVGARDLRHQLEGGASCD